MPACVNMTHSHNAQRAVDWRSPTRNVRAPVGQFRAAGILISVKNILKATWLLFLSLPLLAQSTAVPGGVLAGTVVDPMGAPVPGAHVQISSSTTRWNSTSQTDETGSFQFAAVPEGVLTITALAQGFDAESKQLEASALQVPVKIQLRVAGLSSSVVVTGGRDAVEIDKSVVAVNAVTRDAIEVRNVFLADQALSYEEGLNVYREKGAADTSTAVGMRGFAANSPRVLVLLDGQPMNDAYAGKVTWALLPISEMESVEVLRGPGSVLYGGNAMAGVIQMFTRPVTERSLELSAQGGTFGTKTYSGRFSDRWFHKKLGFSGSYMNLRLQGYPTGPGVYASASTVTSATTAILPAPPMVPTNTGALRFQIGEQGNNGFFQDAIRTRFDYTVSDKTTVTFQYMQMREQYGYNSSVPTVLDSSGNPITSGSFFFNYGGALKKLTISPNLFVAGPGGQTIEYFIGSLYHSFNSRSWLRVGAGTADSIDEWFSLPSGGATFGGGPGTTTQYPNRTSHADLQWNWVPSGRLKYIFGSEIRQDITRNANYNLSNFAVRDSKILYTKGAEGLVMASAAFAQADYQLTRTLNVELGGRFENWRTYGGTSQSAPAAPLVALPSRMQEAFTGRAALSWQLPRDFTLRFVAANAFRGPTVNNLYSSSSYPPGTVTLANPALEPETVRSFEIGLRKRIGQTFTADATFFQNYVQNLIYTAIDYPVDPTGLTNIPVNAGRAYARGVEVALRERLFSWLHLTETYTFNDSRITQNSAVPLSQGRYVTGVPKTVANVSLVGSYRRWSGSLGGRYISALYSTNTNTDIVHGVPGSYDPYFIAEATGGYQLRRGVTAFASVNNMLDRTFYQFYLAPGRAAYVGLRIRLGGDR
jgi:iron complex outermembrane recepter protein